MYIGYLNDQIALFGILGGLGWLLFFYKTIQYDGYRQAVRDLYSKAMEKPRDKKLYLE